MKNSFLKKLAAAGRLTSRGRLVEATAAIQRALAGSALVARPANPRRAATVPAAHRAAAPSTGGGADVATAPPRVAPAAPAGPRFAASSFTNAAGTRAFKLFEPAGGAAAARPLVVMLHGCTQDPDDFAAGTRMNALAEAHGFFVLYPAQAARSNGHKCWNWFVPADQRRGAGEPALLAGMTRHVMQLHGIDPERVYVAGLSAGGAMAAILGREYADLFAAAGIHSGLPAGAAHDVASAFAAMKSGARAGARPAKPSASTVMAPVIVFHGDADATVAAANGDAVIAAALAATPGLPHEEERAAGGGRRSARRKVWRKAGAAAGTPSVAEQWRIEGAPHAWSGGAAAGSYTDPAGPDASAEMLRFFLEHPRRDRAT